MSTCIYRPPEVARFFERSLGFTLVLSQRRTAIIAALITILLTHNLGALNPRINLSIALRSFCFDRSKGPPVHNAVEQKPTWPLAGLAQNRPSRGVEIQSLCVLRHYHNTLLTLSKDQMNRTIKQTEGTTKGAKELRAIIRQ